VTAFAQQAIPGDVLRICRRLRQEGHEAHLVGGGIRDLLVGRHPHDFDVATSALPEAVLALFGARYAIPTGLQHGTVTVLGDALAAGEHPRHRHVEVTTFRGEGEYLDGRRPSTVHFGATLHEDLARRDFTMNAIAYDPLAEVLTDPFDGQRDLAAGIIRAVGDPVERFREDGLRPMRAVRQATQLGFSIESATMVAIGQTLSSFRKVSAERIRDELFKLLAAPAAARGVALLHQTGLLAEILPEVQGAGAEDGRHVHLGALDGVPADPVLRLAGLLGGWGAVTETATGDDGALLVATDAQRLSQHAAAIGQRLRLAGAEQRRLVDLTRALGTGAASGSDADLRRMVRKVGRGQLASWLALRACVAVPLDARLDDQELRARLDVVAGPGVALEPSELAVDGRAIMEALGIGPGPLVGQLLAALLERVLDDQTLNDRVRLIELARTMAQDLSAPPGAR
jgi:tRNA nucleotidyltransferase (CCA-adding enzyme)